jgi:hypothetical protein
VAERELDLTHRRKLARVAVTLSKSELRALDDFRFMMRLPSRTAAFREILRRALRATVDQVGMRADGRPRRTAGRGRLIH